VWCKFNFLLTIKKEEGGGGKKVKSESLVFKKDAGLFLYPLPLERGRMLKFTSPLPLETVS
jgi:hypothetical protein